MNRSGCIHPEILSALAKCGHGDSILIADGNYPIASRCPDSQLVYLGVTSGVPSVTEVLDAVLAEISEEAVTVMDPGTAEPPAIFAEFQERFPGMEFERLSRFDFYDAAKGKARLAISTGEKRVFANVLLTVGCVD